MKKLVPLADMNATFCKIIEDGKPVRCVITEHKTANFALVRPVHQFDRIIRVARHQMFEAF